MLISSYKKSSAPTVIKILSNASRFAIMKLLFNTKKDLCVHEISEKVGISQSATSHQLAYLEACGVVSSVSMGKTRCYMPTNTHIANKIKAIINLL